jgi:hypothetical protein
MGVVKVNSMGASGPRVHVLARVKVDGMIPLQLPRRRPLLTKAMSIHYVCCCIFMSELFVAESS